MATSSRRFPSLGFVVLGFIVLGFIAPAVTFSEVAGSDPTAAQIRIKSEVGSGPIRAFDLVEEQTPKIMLVNRVSRVDLEIENRGQSAWTETEQIFVSYVWYRLEGEKLRKVRSLRTHLPERVEPGQRIRVTAKIRPPRRSGIYELRWDVVQENVQWFSTAIDHPKFEHRVFVLPRIEFWLGSLLPTLLAGFGFIAVKRARHWPVGSVSYSLAAWLPVLWAAVSIYFKPQLLYAEMNLQVGPKQVLANLAVLAAVILVARFLPFRWRQGICWLMAATAAFFVWSQILHYRFFQDVISVTSFLAVGQIGQLGGVIGFLTRGKDLALLVDVLIGFLLVLMMVRLDAPQWKAPRWTRWITISVMTILIAGSVTRMWQLSDWSDRKRGPRMRTIRTVKQYGLYGYQLRDVLTQIRHRWFRPALGENDRLSIERWFQERASLRSGSGPLFGVAKGSNLIAIQVESAQQFILGLRIGDQEVTPNLNRWSRRALVFSQVHDQTGNGRSSAGEFVTWTSIVPVANSVAHEYPSNTYVTPAHVLASQGYTVLSAVPFVRSFWNRHQTYPAYGFPDGLFESDFKQGQKVGWGLSDRDFFEQMKPRIFELPQPFLLWMTTLSLHYPYEKFPSDLKILNLGELDNTPFGNYLHGMHHFDGAFGDLMASLESEGMLDRTVVALWGDHDSGLVHRDGAPEILGISTRWPEFFYADRIPFLIWLPNSGESPEATVGTITSTGGQVDIAPTLLALFGVDPASMAYLGRSLLNESPFLEPVVHPNGNWISEVQLFLDTKDDLAGGACWDLRRKRKIAAERCSEGYLRAQKQLQISEAMLNYDLQESLSKDLSREK